MNKRKHKKLSTGDVVLRIVAYGYFVLFSLCILLPFYIMLKNSITSEAENLMSMKFSWFPQMGVTTDAYNTVMFSDELEIYGISILKGFFSAGGKISTIPPLMEN